MLTMPQAHGNGMNVIEIDFTSNPLVIAEVGNNHEGSFDLASELIEKAASSGVDAVKFQTFQTSKLITTLDEQRVAQLSKFQLTYQQFERLARLCNENGVAFLSTPFDLESVDFVAEQAPAIKISSGDNRNFQLIERAARKKMPLILSTGLISEKELKEVISFIHRIWDVEGERPHLALLHCVSAYPTPAEEANLAAIQNLRKWTPLIGYSDHTMGIDCAITAFIIGARIIEKHFTIAHDFSKFRDHALSATPEEMSELTRKLMTISKSLGTGDIKAEKCELPNIQSLRRSISAVSDLNECHTVVGADLIAVRPGGGLQPGQEHLLIGKKLLRKCRAGEMITVDMVE